MRLARFALTLGILMIPAGCSGGGGSSNPPAEPPPIIVSRTFAPGNAHAQFGGTAWDIVGISSRLFGQFQGAGGNAYDTLSVTVTFAQDVSNALPAPGSPLSSPTQLGISIGYNTDGNASTGGIAACAGTATPDEFLTDPGNNPQRFPDGNYSILDVAGTPIGVEAVTLVNGNSITETVPLGAIGVFAGSAVPNVQIDVGAFNGSSSYDVDCEPKDGSQIRVDGK